jgi:hypothetical protein
VFGLGPLELLIFAVIAVLLILRLRSLFDGNGPFGRGPFVGGFGSVPVDDPPPPRDPVSKREKP